MSVAIEKAVELIERAAPVELAYDWDNSGMQLRCADRIENVLIALDVTAQVVEEAIDKKCDMILTHHPLIFKPVRRIDYENPTGAMITKLIRAGISVYSAHTSYDRAAGGINDLLAAKLGLCDVMAVDGGEGLLRVGALRKAMNLEQFAAHVKQCLGKKYLMISDVRCDSIEKVAVAGGSGGDFAAEAKRAGAHVLVTGEAKHSHFVEACAMEMPMIAAGHHETEQCFIDGIFLSLQLLANEVQLQLGFRKATRNTSPYTEV